MRVRVRVRVILIVIVTAIVLVPVIVIAIAIVIAVETVINIQIITMIVLALVLPDYTQPFSCLASERNCFCKACRASQFFRLQEHFPSSAATSSSSNTQTGGSTHKKVDPWGVATLYMYIYTRIGTFTCVYRYAYINICTHVHTFVLVHLCVFICIGMYMCVVNSQVHMCIYVYIHWVAFLVTINIDCIPTAQEPTISVSGLPGLHLPWVPPRCYCGNL